MTATGEPLPTRELQLAGVLESLSEGVVVADTAGTILFTNPACETVLGWSPGELVGQNLTVLVPERLVGAHEAAFHRHVTTGEQRLIGEPVRLPAQRRDGTEIECEVLLSRHEGDGAALLVGTLRPVASEVSTAEATVGRELLEVLAERLPRAELVPRVLQAIGRALGCQVASFWTIEPSTDQLRCEEIWTGIDAGRFEAVTRGSLFPPGVGLPGLVWEQGRTEWVDDLTTDSNYIRASAAASAGLTSGGAFPLTSGGRFAGAVELYSTEEIVATPDLIAVLAGLGAVLGTFLDRARVEEESRRLFDQVHTERSRLHAVVRQLPQGVAIVDPAGGVILVNTAADRLIGRHAPGDPISIAGPSGAPYTDDALPFARAVANRGSASEEEMEVITAAGDIAFVSITCTAISDRDGRVASVVATFDDVTEVRRERQRLQLLAEASDILAVFLEEEEVLRAIVGVSVPAFVDVCVADAVDERGQARRVAVKAADPETEELVRRAVDQYAADPELDEGVPRVLRTGEPVVYDHVSDELLTVAARDEDHLELLRRLRPSSAVIVPVAGRGETFGALTFSALPPRPELSAHDVELAVELGRRAGLAVANARMYEREKAVANQLQSSLMPPELPEIPGAEVAAAFHPGAEGLLIGGDFYDVFPVDDGAWAVILGDVCGKGAEAAAVAGQVRYTARAIASGRAPAAVLGELNRILLAPETDRFCTMLLAVLRSRPHGLAVTVAAAGHPAPVMTERGGRVTPVSCGGTLLGVVADVTHPEITVDLEDGDSLVLFTDGVLEARGPAGLFGEEGVRRALASAAGGRAEELATALAGAAMVHSDRRLRDDVAVLAIRSVPAGEQPQP